MAPYLIKLKVAAAKMVVENLQTFGDAKIYWEGEGAIDRKNWCWVGGLICRPIQIKTERPTHLLRGGIFWRLDSEHSGALPSCIRKEKGRSG